jgi:hypothetical protein
MTGRYRRLGVGFLLILSSFGCASKKKPPQPRTLPEPCEGQAVLIIENDSGTDLDVMEARVGGGGRTVIATVGPGYHEVLIRGEPGFYYFTRRTQTGTTVVTESRRASVRDPVRMRRECRSS